MNKQQALNLIHQTTKTPNLIKHMLAVAACMKALANYFKENEALWEITGIVHDADFEEMGTNNPSPKIVEYLSKLNADPLIIQTVKTHGWQITPGCLEPQTKMDWSLYCCDHLTGLIIAVTLVRPTKKIANVTVADIMKKWGKKDFAKGSHRENIALCESKLNLKLEEFMAICLKAMQEISFDLGL